MKIGILTQPLHDNYGGLLQAYALKEVLQEMGHEVIIINRQSNRKVPLWRRFASIAKSILIGRRVHPNLFIKSTYRDELSRETRKFRETYIPNLSHLITDNEGIKELNTMGFDAYIVGSDQCWRPKYSPEILNYFLDFVANDCKAKRIAYAASFGVDHWEFSEEDTERSKELLKKFDAISVREDSAIDLIKNYLGRTDAQHVLDPTMLLSPHQYKEIVDKEKIAPSPGNLKVYVLDKTPEKDNLVKLLERKLQLNAFEVLPAKRLNEEKVTKNNINDFVFPNPATWLRGFQDAKFVVTDSFHGTVFSILHNIPFIAVGNVARGLSRFQSLLKMFGLEDRLVADINSVNIDNFAEKEIDWKRVNEVLEKERGKAVGFLKRI
ncbi:MAG: polysaccharide pyruvyl transferase family protein [Dysgonamonadaceae bacterium]|nr:polysaccharide pyruvyl transferase family protein [Dysgonamonadaceae bacterium]